MYDIDEAKELLANELGLDLDEVSPSSENEHIFGVPGQVWWVGTYYDAEAYALQYIKDLQDDMGLDSYNETYQEFIIDNYVKDDFFDDDYEQMEWRLEDEGDEEGLDYLHSLEDDKAAYFREYLGDDEFKRLISQHDTDAIRWDDVAQHQLKEEGIDPNVGSYDGNTTELPNGYVCWRIN